MDHYDNRLTAPNLSGMGTVESVGLSMPDEFSVANSPVTSIGTLAVTKATQAANKVWAGPTNGADAAPTFRALVAADLPDVDVEGGITGVLPVVNGGTNSDTALNNKRIMVSSGDKIVEAGAMTNGQLLIGNTGNAPTVAALTAGSGISITNGAGSITIANTAASGGITWNPPSSSPTSMSPNNGYISGSGDGQLFTLPVTASVGDRMRVVGPGSSSGWEISQNAAQGIALNGSATTPGDTGKLTGSNGATVELLCVTANSTWKVISYTGTLTPS